MPATSEKQKHLMDAAAHNPAFAKKVGIPSKVAKEFSKASKGQTFKQGGLMATKGSGNGITKAKMGSVRTAAPSRDGIASKGKTKGTMISMPGGKVLGTKVGAGKGMCGGGMAKGKK
jgi:hypothetical protein